MVIQINTHLSLLWTTLSPNHEFSTIGGIKNRRAERVGLLNVNLFCPGLCEIPKTPGGNNIDY